MPKYWRDSRPWKVLGRTQGRAACISLVSLVGEKEGDVSLKGCCATVMEAGLLVGTIPSEAHLDQQGLP